MELEASEPPHSFICMDEAGFNLSKRKRRGWNIIGHRATVDVPCQRGGNITMGAAISENGVLMHIPIIVPYNTERLVTFLDTLHGSHPWTREGSDWRWPDKVRDSLGQCQFPLLQHHQTMVCSPQQDANGVHLTLLSIPSPHWGIFHSMEK